MDDEAKRRRLAEAAEKAQLIRQRKGSVSPRVTGARDGAGGARVT